MQFVNGEILSKASIEQVKEHILSCKKTAICDYSNAFSITLEGNMPLLLHKTQHAIKSYPIRKSFLFKLLKWYGISYHNTHFHDKTLIAICNDNLQDISKINTNYPKKVIIYIENDQALSITSENFTPISDLEVLDIASKNMNIKQIFRDDFIMRVHSEIRSEKAPVKNDICGFGIQVVNSQTGFSAINAEHYILRYVCSNGATHKILNSNIRYIHYNVSREKILNDLDKTLSLAPDEPTNFINAVQTAINTKAIHLFPDITYKVNNIIGAKKGYLMFKDFDKKHQNLYELFNHITNKAKKFDILEKYKLEQLAGTLVA